MAATIILDSVVQRYKKVGEMAEKTSLWFVYFTSYNIGNHKIGVIILITKTKKLYNFVSYKYKWFIAASDIWDSVV